MKLVKFTTLATTLIAISAQANEPTQAGVQPHEFGGQMPILQPLEQIGESPTLSSAPQVIESIEDMISAAIVAKDWAVLPKLLVDYRTRADHDRTLYHYAQGAYDRAMGRQREAIRHYEIIAQDESLIYPRFDLAVMYFENKQYRDADALFATLKPLMPVQISGLIDRYQAAIAKAQRWQPSAGFNFEQTDNVNNASDLRTFEINGATFVRSEDSLPQSANGIRYDVGIDKQHNVAGNHYLYASADVDGVYYWDNRDYDEVSVRGELGYRYRDATRTLSLTPFVGRNWLGGDAYSDQYGTTISLSQRLSPQFQGYVSATHLQRRYDDESTARRYDGYSNDGVAMVMYQPNAQWLYHFGVDTRRERLKDAAESSNRSGVRLGVGYYGEQLGAQASVRFSQRQFNAPNFWYDTVRRDHEINASAAVWHNKLSYKGFIPKLNYRYQEIDSNLPLYDRRSQAWFITIDKQF